MKITFVFLVVMLVLVEETNAGVCILKMVNGKMQKYGDCDNNQKSQVLNDLDNKLKKMEKKYEKTNNKTCRNVVKSFAKVSDANGGVFDIYPESIGSKVEVYCDLVTDGGGWTVFQRRVDGSEEFYRNWDDYVNGFGTKDKEFWLGLENLHQMTKNGNYELRVELQDFDGNTSYAKYGSFSVGSSAENYRLTVGSYNGTAGDSLSYHNGIPFTTIDRDNDAKLNINCATQRKGGWWYDKCSLANLNGEYNDAVGIGANGVVWRRWKDRDEYLKFTEMKFRHVE